MYPDINKKEKSKQEMKADIILSGVGGQGILSIAAVIGEAALKEGLYMKQAEVHGMSQRGGSVGGMCSQTSACPTSRLRLT